MSLELDGSMMRKMMGGAVSVSVCFQFESIARAKLFLSLVSKKRPEFEDEVEERDIAWFRVFSEWPYPAHSKRRKKIVNIVWKHSRLSIDDLDDVASLEGVKVIAAHEFLKGALFDEDEIGPEEGSETSVYYRYLDGRPQRVKYIDRVLESGYELTHEDETIFDDLFELSAE